MPLRRNFFEDPRRYMIRFGSLSANVGNNKDVSDGDPEGIPATTEDEDRGQPTENRGRGRGRGHGGQSDEQAVEQDVAMRVWHKSARSISFSSSD